MDKRESQSKTKTRKTGSSSLSQLLSKKNKNTRKSFSFEEDDGFVFKRSNSSLNEEEQLPVKKKKTEVKKTEVKKKRGRLKKTPNTLLTQIETPSDEEKKPLKRGRKPKKEFKFEEQQQISPPISSPAKLYEETSIQMLLPISDSPIQRKNKEFRDSKKRRSSLSNRGKRVSSIGNGFVAVPHSDVPVEEFYKHLDESLPEPHKMRALLIWCSKKLLAREESQRTKKISSDDLTAFNIAKVIKEEIIRDLVDGRLNTSWYNRVDEIEEPQPVKLLPNPQNLTNIANIEALEKRLQILKEEKRQWHEAYDTISKMSISEPNLELPLDIPISDEINKLETNFDNFNKKLLLANSLEFKIDQLEKLVNNLSTNDKVLSLFQAKIKSRINSILNDYTTDAKIDTKQLLKGIAKIEGKD